MPRPQKALPPTPVLPGQDSREHRGTFNTTNSKSTALTERLPSPQPESPRRPSSSITGPPGSFKNTSPLSAFDCSPASPEGIKCGTTKAICIQPFDKVRSEFDLKHPRSTKTTLIREKFNKGLRQSISVMPSTNRRCSNAQKVTSKMRYSSFAIEYDSRDSKSAEYSPLYTKPASDRSPHSGQAIDNHRRSRVDLVAAKLEKRLNSHKQVDNPSTAPHPAQCEETPPEIDPSASNREGPSFERSETYGYRIRESFEAHQVIMGEAVIRELKSELVASRGNIESNEMREDVDSNTPLNLDISNTVPMIRRVRKQAELNKEHSIRQGAREVYRTVGIKPPGQISHPKRSSSLLSAPSSSPSATSVNIHPSYDISAEGAIPTERERHASRAESASQAGRGDRSSHTSLFYRQTVSSAARTSTKCEKEMPMTPSNISTSRFCSQGGRNSLGSVGMGMKKLSEKVSKIISSRHARATAPFARGTVGKGSRSLEGSILASELRRPSSSPQTTGSDSDADNSTGRNSQISLANKRIEHRVVRAKPSASNIFREIIANPNIQTCSAEEFLAREADIQPNVEGADFEQGIADIVVAPGPGTQSDYQIPIQQNSDAATNIPTHQDPQAGNSIGVDNAAEKMQDATNNLLRFVDANVLQWVRRAREMEESPLRNYLIEAATQTADGLTMAREVRMASLRLDQIVHGLAGRLADNAVAVAMTFNIYPQQ
jgi:hypothetical protein